MLGSVLSTPQFFAIVTEVRQLREPMHGRVLPAAALSTPHDTLRTEPHNNALCTIEPRGWRAARAPPQEAHLVWRLGASLQLVEPGFRLIYPWRLDCEREQLCRHGGNRHQGPAAARWRHRYRQRELSECLSKRGAGPELRRHVAGLPSGAEHH